MLVIDDDPDILQTLGLCLSSEGYRVLMAANGKEALDILEREQPNVILLDLMMPVMDGWQFVAELDHRGQRDVPLLILSADRSVQGHAQQLRAQSRRQSADEGSGSFLAKDVAVGESPLAHRPFDDMGEPA